MTVIPTTWLGMAAASLLLSALPFLASSSAEPVFTTLTVRPLIRPQAVEGADARRHLVYELVLVNQTSLLAQVDVLIALDGATGAVLAEWRGEALSSILRINGGEPGTTLAPAHSAYAFLDVSLPLGARLPESIQHRLSVTNLQKSAGTDEHTGVPLDPSLPIPGTSIFEAAPLAPDTTPPLRLLPPLRGADWIAFNGCCAEITSHRGSVMAFDGEAVIAERFAVDFVRLDPEGRLFHGPAERVDSYPGFGVPVHAAAEGIVVAAKDGMAEGVPGQRSALPLDEYAGNHVVIDMGGGHFALYAHLATGSIGVRLGARVVASEVIGRLGNTGNSDAPHLHFQVMDGPAPLSSSGLPYEFRSFEGTGLIAVDNEAFSTGAPARIDRSRLSGPRENALPLNNQRVQFPP